MVFPTKKTLLRKYPSWNIRARIRLQTPIVIVHGKQFLQELEKLAAERRAEKQIAVPRKQSNSRRCLFKHSGPQRHSLRKCRHNSDVASSNTDRNTSFKKDQYVQHMKSNQKEFGDADSLLSSSTDEQSAQVQKNTDVSDDTQNVSTSAISSSQKKPKVKGNFKQSNVDKTTKESCGSSITYRKKRKQKTQKRKILSDNQEGTSRKTKDGAEEDMKSGSTIFKRRKGNGAGLNKIASVENDISSNHNKDNALLKAKHSGKLSKKMIAGVKIMDKNSPEETVVTAVQDGTHEAIFQDKYQMKRVLRRNSKHAKGISKHTVFREESDSDTAIHFLKCNQQSSITLEKEIDQAQNMSTERVQKISKRSRRLRKKIKRKKQLSSSNHREENVSGTNVLKEDIASDLCMRQQKNRGNIIADDQHKVDENKGIQLDKEVERNENICNISGATRGLVSIHQMTTSFEIQDTCYSSEKVQKLKHSEMDKQLDGCTMIKKKDVDGIACTSEEAFMSHDILHKQKLVVECCEPRKKSSFSVTDIVTQETKHDAGTDKTIDKDQDQDNANGSALEEQLSDEDIEVGMAQTMSLSKTLDSKIHDNIEFEPSVRHARTMNTQRRKRKAVHKLLKSSTKTKPSDLSGVGLITPGVHDEEAASNEKRAMQKNCITVPEILRVTHSNHETEDVDSKSQNKYVIEKDQIDWHTSKNICNPGTVYGLLNGSPETNNDPKELILKLGELSKDADQARAYNANDEHVSTSLIEKDSFPKNLDIRNSTAPIEKEEAEELTSSTKNDKVVNITHSDHETQDVNTKSPKDCIIAKDKIEQHTSKDICNPITVDKLVSESLEINFDPKEPILNLLEMSNDSNRMGAWCTSHEHASSSLMEEDSLCRNSNIGNLPSLDEKEVAKELISSTKKDVFLVKECDLHDDEDKTMFFCGSDYENHMEDNMGTAFTEKTQVLDNMSEGTEMVDLMEATESFDESNDMGIEEAEKNDGVLDLMTDCDPEIILHADKYDSVQVLAPGSLLHSSGEAQHITEPKVSQVVEDQGCAVSHIEKEESPIHSVPMADHVDFDIKMSRQPKSKSMYRSWYSKRRYHGKRHETLTLWNNHTGNRKSADNASSSQASISDTPVDSTTSKNGSNIGNPVEDRKQVVSHIPPLRTTARKHFPPKKDTAKVANSGQSSQLEKEASVDENVDATAKLQTPSQRLRVWEQSLRPTPSKVKRFQAGQATKPEGSQKGGKKKRNDMAEEKIEPMQNSRKWKAKSVGPPIPEGKYTIGTLVWGKMKGFTWWPARIIHHYEAGRTEMPSPDLRWVQWFGDKKLSLLAGDKLSPFQQFETHFNENYYSRVALYRRAVFEITKLAAERSEKQLQSDIPKIVERGGILKAEEDKAAYIAVCEELIEWAREGFPSDRPDAIDPSPEEGKIPRPPLPVWCPPSPKPSTSSSGQVQNKNDAYEDQRGQRLEDLRKGTLKIKDMCIGCGELTVVAEHPLFEGGLCAVCRIEFIEVAYLFDRDGYQSYCCICAEGTHIVLCSQTGCGRSFCVDCLELLVAPEESIKVINLDPWCCYMCKPDPKQGFLVRRSDWSERLLNFFQDDIESNFEPLRTYPAVKISDRKNIRVLSLFDGIGTAMLVLKELGLNVECYYASEISKNAITVTTVRHKNAIQQIGDVTTINTSKLKSLGQIDLLIGGSPCNDLTILNPARRGLYGTGSTGQLFFDFYRIMLDLRQGASDTRPFFWLFENVVFMAHSDKMNISRFVECNPVLIDAKDFSPANRARYFWGNLPGMNRPRIAVAESTLDLQDALEGNCNRQAQCTKVRTITTKSNSVKQKEQFHPVKMDGEEDTLWCTELERIFGFPEHYTDVANLSRTKRQQLLGQAWSVPVIKHLLTPLKDYFVSKTQ